MIYKKLLTIKKQEDSVWKDCVAGCTVTMTAAYAKGQNIGGQILRNFIGYANTLTNYNGSIAYLEQFNGLTINAFYYEYRYHIFQSSVIQNSSYIYLVWNSQDINKTYKIITYIHDTEVTEEITNCSFSDNQLYKTISGNNWSVIKYLVSQMNIGDTAGVYYASTNITIKVCEV